MNTKMAKGICSLLITFQFASGGIAQAAGKERPEKLSNAKARFAKIENGKIKTASFLEGVPWPNPSCKTARLHNYASIFKKSLDQKNTAYIPYDGYEIDPNKTLVCNDGSIMKVKLSDYSASGWGDHLRVGAIEWIRPSPRTGDIGYTSTSFVPTVFGRKSPVDKDQPEMARDYKQILQANLPASSQVEDLELEISSEDSEAIISGSSMHLTSLYTANPRKAWLRDTVYKGSDTHQLDGPIRIKMTRLGKGVKRDFYLRGSQLRYSENKLYCSEVYRGGKLADNYGLTREYVAIASIKEKLVYLRKVIEMILELDPNCKDRFEGIRCATSKAISPYAGSEDEFRGLPHRMYRITYGYDVSDVVTNGIDEFGSRHGTDSWLAKSYVDLVTSFNALVDLSKKTLPEARYGHKVEWLDGNAFLKLIDDVMSVSEAATWLEKMLVGSAVDFETFSKDYSKFNMALEAQRKYFVGNTPTTFLRPSDFEYWSGNWDTSLAPDWMGNKSLDWKLRRQAMATDTGLKSDGLDEPYNALYRNYFSYSSRFELNSTDFYVQECPGQEMIESWGSASRRFRKTVGKPSISRELGTAGLKSNPEL